MQLNAHRTGPIAAATRTVFLAAFVAIGLAYSDRAAADPFDCPYHLEATYSFDDDPEAERSSIEDLAAAAKSKGAVCIIAYYGGPWPANAKMFAFRRANWASRLLRNKGVPAETITRILRLSDQPNTRLIQIVLGP